MIITEIGELDSFFNDRKELIGHKIFPIGKPQKNKGITFPSIKGFMHGDFMVEDMFGNEKPTKVYFLAVKYKKE